MDEGKLKGAKFGDMIINHWACHTNPHRESIFIRYKKNTIYVTDMKGDFWEPCNDSHAKLEIVGSVLNPDRTLK